MLDDTRPWPRGDPTEPDDGGPRQAADRGLLAWLLLAALPWAAGVGCLVWG